MTTLISKIQSSISFTLDRTAEIGKSSDSFDGYGAKVLANGTGQDQADQVFRDRRTIVASGNENLDLNALTDPVTGAAINFAKIKAILIRAAAANTNNVVVGAAASNPFLGPLGGTAPTLTLKPGDSVLLAAPKDGWSSANGASDQLKVANSGSGTAVDYEIVLIGTSA